MWAANWLIESITHESTDDAFVDAHVVTVAPKVAGIVKAVHVRDNQFVHKGDLLVEIDPRDFEARLAQKRAAADASQANANSVRSSFEVIKARVTTAEASAKQVTADVTAAEAANEKAQSDLKRDEQLKDTGAISQQEYQTAKSAADAAAANLRSVREKLGGETSKVHEVEAQLVAARSVIDVSGAQLAQAKADLAAAELDLSYTKIAAPVDGRVTNKRVEAGDYLQAGQSLFALVPTNIWVTANFKETQLKSIRTNQPAEVEIDAIASRHFKGHVESIQAGSGARFSLLPPENAVGNFVKVVQRVPVRILFDEPVEAEHVIGPGMSVTPSVQTSTLHLPTIIVAAAAGIVAFLLTALLWRLTAPKEVA